MPSFFTLRCLKIHTILFPKMKIFNSYMVVLESKIKINLEENVYKRDPKWKNR